MAKSIQDRLAAALEGLRHGKGGCFCESAWHLSGPSTHSPACRNATTVLAAHAAGAKRQATGSMLESFARFKAAYPRPTGMSKAKEVWIAMAPTAALVAHILAKIELFKQTTWAGREQNLIPHATTFLRQRRWEDEPEAPGTSFGRRPDFKGSTPTPREPSAPLPDRIGRQVTKLLDALAGDNLSAKIGRDRAEKAAVLLRAIPLGERATAEAMISKIERRLFDVVVDELSQAELDKCRREAEELMAVYDIGRMSVEAQRAAKAHAFHICVCVYTGLPAAY